MGIALQCQGLQAFSRDLHPLHVACLGIINVKLHVAIGTGAYAHVTHVGIFFLRVRRDIQAVLVSVCVQVIESQHQLIHTCIFGFHKLRLIHAGLSLEFTAYHETFIANHLYTFHSHRLSLIYRINLEVQRGGIAVSGEFILLNARLHAHHAVGNAEFI